jgi:hypothetical protein
MVAAFRFDEWDTVYKNVMRVLKPGGYIQVMEPDIRVRNDILLLDGGNHSLCVIKLINVDGM